MMLKIGVIGYGGRIHGIVDKLIATGKCELTAIMDVRCNEIREELQEKHPDVRCYSDADEMLQNERLDGVAIGTRCYLHAHYAQVVAKYGVPMFLEKPVCIQAEDLKKLEGILHMNDKTVVSFPLRLSKLVQTVKQELDSGKIGTISQVQAYNNVYYARGYYHKWYRDDSQTGGLFLQKATHDLDYINYLLGEDVRPVRLCAMDAKVIFKGDKPAGLKCVDCAERETCTESDLNVAKSDGALIRGEYCCYAVDTGNQDSGTVLLQYNTGIHTVYTQNFVARKAAGKRGARFIGYKATLEFDFNTSQITIYHHLEDRVDHIKIDPKGSHSGGDFDLVDNFIDVMRGCDVSHSDLRSGIESARLCLMAEKSARTHMFVEEI